MSTPNNSAIHYKFGCKSLLAGSPLPTGSAMVRTQSVSSCLSCSSRNSWSVMLKRCWTLTGTGASDCSMQRTSPKRRSRGHKHRSTFAPLTRIFPKESNCVKSLRPARNGALLVKPFCYNYLRSLVSSVLYHNCAFPSLNRQTHLNLPVRKASVCERPLVAVLLTTEMAALTGRSTRSGIVFSLRMLKSHAGKRRTSCEQRSASLRSLLQKVSSSLLPLRS